MCELCVYDKEKFVMREPVTREKMIEDVSKCFPKEWGTMTSMEHLVGELLSSNEECHSLSKELLLLNVAEYGYVNG